MKLFAAIGFLCVTSVVLAASKPTTKAASSEAEDEQMIHQVEQMGKSIQEALGKIAAQMKSGSSSEKDTAAAKQNLEQLAKKLQMGQAALLKGSATRAPGAEDSASSEMMKTLQNFVQGLTSKVIENANQTVDKLNKMSDESP